MKKNRVNDEAYCPKCNTQLNGASDPIGEAVPKPGDLSVCIYCAELLVFNTDMTLRSLAFKEMLELPDAVQANLQRFRAAIRARIRLAGTNIDPA
jgi:hypothetical protein